MKPSFSIKDLDFTPVCQAAAELNRLPKAGSRDANVAAYASKSEPRSPTATEDDGFITVYPAHATTQPGPARMTLADARAVRADLIHHTDADVIEAARVIIAESADRFEQRAARKLLHVMLRTTEHGGDDA